MEIKDHINQLRNILNEHNINYYVNDNPSISDNEYDVLLKKLELLEKQNPQYFKEDSPTQRIGGQALKEFKSIIHRIPMQSLANAMNKEDLIQFDKQIKKLLDTEKSIEYVAELKLDGLAVELVYEKGNFVYGSTRGDGVAGEDITNNLKTIKAIPLSINGSDVPEILEIRGEVFINKEDFKILNDNRLENNQSVFANPRNCAAGSLRQLDSNITMTRPLRIFCYAPGIIKGMTIDSQKMFLAHLPKWGFPVNPYIKVGKGLDFLNQYYEEAEVVRGSLPYDIDGVVFKVNSYASQKKIGVRSKSPRWAIAGKLKAQQATSVIENIIISVGRTGALTPVAKIKPVSIGGVIITNATLHNQDEIDRKDIRINDTVLVQRAGDVIPEIVKVIREKRSINSKIFLIPKTCPICLSEVVKLQGEVVSRCENLKCSAKIQGHIEHFVSKNCMNIDGLGTKIVELLIQNNLIENIDDIFYLKSENLSNLNRMGEKSAANIIKSIENAKLTTLARFLSGLGIRHIGQNTAKILDKYCRGDINKLIQISKNQLLNVNEVGEIMAESIITYFKNDENLKIVNNCISSGIKFKSSEIVQSDITNQTFVFTGNLNELTRNDAIKLIEKYGAKSSSSISRKTDYLVSGSNVGSKLTKANAFNIKILNEESFIKLLDSLKD